VPAARPASELQLSDSSTGAVLRIRVVPRAGRSALAGVRDGALFIRVAAAPVRGAANDALTEVLASVLDLRRIQLVSAGRARLKRVRIEGLGASEVVRRLTAALGGR
jgi:uncharacterized protein YggU (UPF0235/DUF167 family)